MNTSGWFDNLPVIGALPPEEAIAALHSLGEDEIVEALEETLETTSPVFGPGNRKRLWFLLEKPWLHTSHSFGYLAPALPGDDALPIRSVHAIHADPTLKHARLRITLDYLRVASYPGKGTHRVLVHFFAQNQVPGKIEDLNFNATYRVLDGEHAAVRGYPIFVGLTVGSEGMRLRCRTINVKNDQDEALLNVLESDVFKSGLQIVSTAQPALAPLSELALGLARTIAARHRNISVQDFDLGLDFSNLAMRIPLAEGNYLAVQTPEDSLDMDGWDWNDWVYHPGSGQVVKRSDHRQVIPFNYLVFGVSRYEGP